MVKILWTFIQDEKYVHGNSIKRYIFNIISKRKDIIKWKVWKYDLIRNK